VTYCFTNQLWAFTHRHHPADDEDAADRRSLIRPILDLPSGEQPQPSSKHFYFSLLYTAAHVFNFMNMVMFWAVLFPQGQVNIPEGGNGGLFDGGWLRPFSIVNLYGVTSFIAAIEVIFLNSINHERVSLLSPNNWAYVANQ